LENELHYDQNGVSIVIRATGRATRAGFEAHLRGLLALPTLRLGRDVLLDYRSLEFGETSAYDVRANSKFVISLSEQLGTGRWAIVMGSERDYALGRMWASYTADGVKVVISVFRSIEEAEKWLLADRKLSLKKNQKAVDTH